MKKLSGSMLGIYIHIPFCKNICSYCDFCKMYYHEKYVYSYLDALEKEILSRYNFLEVDTIYIGGGTPNCLSLKELKRLLDIVSIFKKKDNYEYTIECNISQIDCDKLALFKGYGVNRLSFGVQSFDDDILKILGRNHNGDLVFKNINLSKKYFSNISIDLIYGVNNNIELIKKDLDNFFKLDIPHISCYSLILEENTKLYIDKHEYINEEDDVRIYNYIQNTLRKHNYNHYEVSNYAKEGYESCHNKNYWMNGFYYGFGLGAVSYIDNYRISNTKNLTKYIQGNYLQRFDYEDVFIQKENDLILGLRLIDGIDYNLFNEKYNDDLLNRDVIRKLLILGKLVVSDGRLKCNYKYIYLLNNILVDIMGSDL